MSQPFTIEDFTKVKESFTGLLKERNKMIFLTQCLTGLRIGDILQIRIHAVYNTKLRNTLIVLEQKLLRV